MLCFHISQRIAVFCPLLLFGDTFPNASQLPRIRSAIMNHLRWERCPHTPSKDRINIFRIEMYFILQRLIFGVKLCYTIRGQRFMLSVNYEKCPFLGVFSEVIQPCNLIWHYSKKFRILLFPSDFLPRSKWFPRTIRSWSPRSRSLWWRSSSTSWKTMTMCRTSGTTGSRNNRHQNTAFCHKSLDYSNF